MKTLIAVRHAKSSWDEPWLSDHDRPLNKRGERNAPEMGWRLADRKIFPEILVSSTAVRALETARLMAKEISFSPEKIIQERKLFHSAPREIIAVVRHLPANFHSAMIFLHNPGITDFVNRICDISLDNIPTAGMAAIQFEAWRWDEVDFGNGKLLFYDYPKKEYTENK